MACDQTKLYLPSMVGKELTTCLFQWITILTAYFKYSNMCGSITKIFAAQSCFACKFKLCTVQFFTTGGALFRQGVALILDQGNWLLRSP